MGLCVNFLFGFSNVFDFGIIFHLFVRIFYGVFSGLSKFFFLFRGCSRRFSTQSLDDQQAAEATRFLFFGRL